MTGRTFLDLRPRDCRFPLGPHDEPPVMFCGALAREGSPYCQHHHTVAYVRTRRAQPQDRQRQAIAMIEANDRAKPFTGRACLRPPSMQE